MSNKKKYLLVYNMIFLLFVVIVANFYFYGTPFFNVFGQEKNVLYSSNDISGFANGYSINENQWKVVYTDPNVLLELGKIKKSTILR